MIGLSLMLVCVGLVTDNDYSVNQYMHVVISREIQ